jgi:glucose/mannose-6-phosphate isomerase
MVCGAVGVEGVVADRWKDQVNLNSKMHAFASCLPEASHNEIDGWEMANAQCESFAVVIVRDPDDRSKIADRIEITKTLIPKGFPLHDVPLEGTNAVEKLLSGFYLADLVSIYLAVLNRIDPSLTTGVEAIKEEMGKVEEAEG